MAGTSDKARFYLEQYVSELQEYGRKGIFSKEEISSIASKRSDFEHVLNARGSKPSDYARYATYEMNLDSLRKKRCKRLGVKSTGFSGQRTLFFIFDRGTKKFPGDMGLWMQYITYCQREKASKKLARVFTNVLRLKPREWSLWVLAAKHYAENQGDMGTARSYLQRGLRFCKDEKKLWLEYLRLEMIYLAKLAARRKILGLDGLANEKVNPNDEDGDMLVLPTVTAEDISPDSSRGVEGIDEDTLQKLASAPAFTGALPKAIFDAAMKQFNDDAEIAEEIFDLCASFDNVPSTKSILQYIIEHLLRVSPESAEGVMCHAKMELLSISALSTEFPAALGVSLAVIRQAQNLASGKRQSKLAEKAAMMFVPYLRLKVELDEDVVAVLEASVRRYLRQISQMSSLSKTSGQSQDALTGLLTRLGKDGRDSDAELLQEYTNSTELG